MLHLVILARTHADVRCWVCRSLTFLINRLITGSLSYVKMCREFSENLRNFPGILGGIHGLILPKVSENFGKYRITLDIFRKISENAELLSTFFGKLRNFQNSFGFFRNPKFSQTLRKFPMPGEEKLLNFS